MIGTKHVVDVVCGKILIAYLLGGIMLFVESSIAKQVLVFMIGFSVE